MAEEVGESKPKGLKSIIESICDEWDVTITLKCYGEWDPWLTFLQKPPRVRWMAVIGKAQSFGVYAESPGEALEKAVKVWKRRRRQRPDF